MSARRPRKITRQFVCDSVARGLREFGYPDVTSEMIGECLTAFNSGKRDLEMPHGIVGAFASRQFDEVEAVTPGVLANLS